MMEEAFVAYLLGGVDLQSLVNGRLTWAVRKQGSQTPAIVLHNISDMPVYSDEGDSGLASARIQTDSWGKTYAQAKDASRALFNRLNENGAKFTQGDYEFQFAFKEDEQDTFERGAAAEELYRTRLDFIIMYRRTL